METKEKHGRAQTFAIWFGLAALMFGTQMGGSMAAGTYAVGYFAPYGGGWLLVFIAIYFCFRSAFAIHALEFTRLFKTDNYSAYYLELYGLNSDTANPMLKKLVMWMFDIYTTVGGIIVVSGNHQPVRFSHRIHRNQRIYGQIDCCSHVRIPKHLWGCLPKKVQHSHDRLTGRFNARHFSGGALGPRERIL